MEKSLEKQAQREAEREEFFQNLSAEHEATLRTAVVDALSAEGGSVRLNKVSADRRVKEAKATFFPRSGAVSISVWIQRRMADELVVQPDPVARDNQILSFADASLIQESAKSDGGGAQRPVKKEKGSGKGGDSALPRKGKDKGTKGGTFGPPTLDKGKGAHRQTPYGKGGDFAFAPKGGGGALGPQPWWPDDGKGKSYGCAPAYGRGSYGQDPYGQGAFGGAHDFAMWAPPSYGKGAPLSYGKGKAPMPDMSKGKDKGKDKGKGKRKAAGADQAPAFEKEPGAKNEILAAERDAFFEGLPASGFLEDEAALMDAFSAKLTSLGGSARLNNVVSDPVVKQAKMTFLPKNIGIAHWIERRVANILELKPDPVALNNQIVSMIEADASAGLAAVKEERLPWNENAAGERPKNEAAAAEREAFFEGLPPTDFVEEEAALLDAMLAKIESMGGSGRLNNVVSEPNVKQAKIQLLPKGVGLAHWIERRVNNRLKLEPDPVAKGNQIVSIIAVDNMHQVRIDERAAFFDTLPAALSGQEQHLVDALFEKLDTMGGSGRLNQVVSDPRVKQAKTALLPKGVGIAAWIDHRVSGELVVEPDPVALNNQIVRRVSSVGGEPMAKRRKV